MTNSRPILCCIPFAWLFITAAAAYWLFSWDTPSEQELRYSLRGNFLHITDIHPDPYYRTNATARSSCHRIALQTMKKPKHMKRGTAGPWGAPGTICDSPVGLVDTTFDWLSENWRDGLDFIIWTGDNARHDNDDSVPRKEKEIIDLNRLVTDKFIQTFAPIKHGKPNYSKMIPIIPCIGNNDVYPTNVISAGPNFMLDSLADLWAPFIPKTQMRFFRRGGYFVKEVIPNKLVVVSLNTLYFFKANSAVHGCKTVGEPGKNHMVWLDNVLKRTQQRGMRAYLVGHVAPRRKHYTPTCYRHLELFDFPSENNTSMSASKDKVSTTVYNLGRYIHRLFRHYETVPPARQVENGDYAVVHINPSIIPTFFPALRIFQYNTTTESNTKKAETAEKVLDFHTNMYDEVIGENQDNKVLTSEDDSSDADNWDGEDEFPDITANISVQSTRPRPHDPQSPVHSNTFLTLLGYDQYYINLRKANANPRVRPRYEIEYTTKHDYNMDDLTVRSWIQLARKVARNGIRSKLGRKVLDHLIVGTRNIIKERAAQGELFLEGNAGVKGPGDYLREDLWF
ncbi:7083_t:CDS:2 [Paraglomus occultum]|uniref:7083_t:CDS:1 n=1 Tax=Paraglomus occultum TaxID=144539 RepID=A0A9N9G7Q1_9GLOM|nr:7083_t:CDS:2 [Paraglomus occultum]